MLKSGGAAKMQIIKKYFTEIKLYIYTQNQTDMKKLIYLLAVVLLFASCKKEAGNCYRCTFYDSNNSGYIEPTRTVCTDEYPSVLYDKDGNEVAFTCVKN